MSASLTSHTLTALKGLVRIPALLVPAVLMVASCASAQPPGGDDQSRGDRRGPPPEATEACSSLSEGDSCSFEDREGESLSGQCFMPPNDDRATLACRPEGNERGNR